MSVITLKMNEQDQKKLYETFADSASDQIPPYSRWQLRVENCVITCYTSGKVVFQGKDAEVYASPFIKEEAQNGEQFPQAGSDEVGTGDYFGPVCVCATIVEEKDLPEIHALGVRDSKSVTDKDIRSIAPQLMKLLRYSLLIVPPEKYNQVHLHNNMNAIKAKLHNQAYVNLSRKTALPSFKIIDQFAEEPIYYHYLKNEPVVIRGIHFETKAENKYPAVGAASIIARYAFLVSMDEMSAKYGMSFAKGAGSDADQCALKFIDRYGFDKLPQVAKIHFKNTEKLKKG